MAKVAFDPNSPETWPVVITCPSVAKILGCSHTKVYQMVRDGEIPGLKFGKLVRIPREAVLKLLREGNMAKAAGE